MASATRAGTRDSGRDVLAVNGAFYRAFAARDLRAMEALWATGVPVACIHPGWNVLRGRDLVMGSWRSILASDSCPDVVCANATVQVLGDSALVVCEEQIAHDVLVATNIFVNERGTWKLAHHQAAPVASEMLESIDDDDDEDDDDESGTRGQLN